MTRAIPSTICLALLFSACASSAPSVVVPAPAPEPTPAYRTLERVDRRPAIVEPPSTRQLREGYWLGAMIDQSHVPWLHSTGIRVVLSAVNPSQETVDALDQWGIEHVRVPMSSSFNHSELILEVVDTHAPAEVFIHCRHGADRTGAIAAFLLVVRHDWAIPDAFFSVLYRHESDVEGLTRVLGDRGMVETRTVDDPSVGFYSVAAAGGVGGLKARNARYARLVETTLDAIMAYFGVDLSS